MPNYDGKSLRGGSRRQGLPRTLVPFLLCASMCVPPGCKPKSNGTDSTPPEFLQVMVRLEAPVGPPSGEFEITTQDVSRSGLASNLALRLIATAGDAESGISNISIESDLTWQCSFGPQSATVGIVQNAPLAFQPFSPPPSPITPLQVNVVSNPIPQTACDRFTFGHGPINIRGYVRAVATSGAGVAIRSKTFLFEYADVFGSDTPYMSTCRSHGVPIPPDWSLSTLEWTLQGNLKDGTNLLNPGKDAFVWTYADPVVRGACIALPRSGGGTRGGLSGIICQSATTGHACFWDNRRRNNANPQAQMPLVDWTTETLVISQLKDATNLTDPGSGVCPTCHSGNNVFLIVPDDKIWAKVLRGPLATAPGSTFTTRIEASSDNQGGGPRYVPLAGNRPGWDNPFRPATCTPACHESHAPEAWVTQAQAQMPPTCAANNVVEACYQ